MKKEEIAQWVIDNRYPKNELTKVSDHELYHALVQQIEIYAQQVAKEAAADGWVSVGDGKPTEYGKYEVYRHGCKKQHYETWNNTGWAYNNNDITHFRKIIPPAK